LLLPLIAVVLLNTCSSKTTTHEPATPTNSPLLILWAWERPEDLEFLDPHQVGVAFLAQTLTLKKDDVIYTPRRQPLKVQPTTKMIAVTRIESQKQTKEPAALSDAQRQKLVTLILKTLEPGNVSGLQIDFDAAQSEREFYRSLLTDLRGRLPAQVGLSITALASFCIGDPWLEHLPIDEAVPMIFRMGADERSIKNRLAAGEDFRPALCRKSYGISLDEPLTITFAPNRTIYIFNPRPWTKNDLASLPSAVMQ